MAVPKKIGFAVAGLGRISQKAILPAFQHSKSARLVALVSGDISKARRLAAAYGTESCYTYQNYRECVTHPEIDAVFIATPNQSHAEYTIAAAESGRHVLCEKPMAASVPDCERMIEACRAHEVRLMIAYRKYFEPASLALKKLIKSGKLGRLKIIHSAFSFMMAPPGKAPAWHFDREASGGGSLLDVGIYCINTARWLTELEPLEASAYAWSIDPERYREVEESIAFQLKFPGGLLMQATSSFGAAQASFIKVFGEKGWASLDPAFAYDEERNLFGKVQGRCFQEQFEVIDEFALEIDAFADCINRGRDPEPSGLEGLRDARVMESIYRAAKSGGWVPVESPLALA